MIRPLRIQDPGAYYHATCRGNDLKKIFLGTQDQEFFLEKLSMSLGVYNVSLLTYVCISSHFHLSSVTFLNLCAISQAGKQLQIRLEREAKLKKKFDELSDQLIRLSRGKIWVRFPIRLFMLEGGGQAKGSGGGHWEIFFRRGIRLRTGYQPNRRIDAFLGPPVVNIPSFYYFSWQLLRKMVIKGVF